MTLPKTVKAREREPLPFDEVARRLLNTPPVPKRAGVPKSKRKKR